MTQPLFVPAGVVSMQLEVSAYGSEPEAFKSIRRAKEVRRHTLQPLGAQADEGTEAEVTLLGPLLASIVVDHDTLEHVRLAMEPEVGPPPSEGGLPTVYRSEDRVLAKLNEPQNGFGTNALIMTLLRNAEDVPAPVYDIDGERYREARHAVWGPTYEVHSHPEGDVHDLERALVWALCTALHEKVRDADGAPLYPPYEEMKENLHTDEMYNLYFGPAGGARWPLMRPSRQWIHVVRVEGGEGGRVPYDVAEVNPARPPIRTVLPVMTLGMMDSNLLGYLVTDRALLSQSLAERHYGEHLVLEAQLDDRVRRRYDDPKAPKYQPFPEVVRVPPKQFARRLRIDLQKY